MSESQQLFDLIVTGHRSDKPVEALVREVLTLLDDHSPHLEFKLSDALLFSNGMTSIRDGVSHEEAEAIRQQLLTLHVDCDIRPTLQIVPKEAEISVAETAVYTCPACGHQQPKRPSRDGRLEACEACGIVGERYQKGQRLQQVMESEKHRHENERSKRIREVLERAKQEEEALLQQEARRRLGLAEKPNRIGLKVAAAVAAISIGLGAVYYLNQPSPEELAKQEEEATKAAAEAEQKKQDALAKTVQKVAEMSGRIQNMIPSGASGPSGNIDAMIDGEGAGASPSPFKAVPAEPKAGTPPAPQSDTSKPDIKETPEARKAKITQALQDDAKEPDTPAKAAERKVKAKVSAAAVTEMEGAQLTTPRFQISQDEHAENRHRIQQFLKLNETDLTDAVIEQTQEAYPRTLLLLDIAEWHTQHQKPDKAQQALERIQQELAQSRDVTQQALIMGCISKAYLLQNQWEQAGQSLQEAIEKARTLPQPPEQIGLLTRLANEQALFGNQIAARQVLEEAGRLASTLPNGLEPRSSSYIQIASGYATLTDFGEANKFLPKVEDPTKRQKLAEFIDKLQHRVEQAQAEYQQTMATGRP
ncbi:hypothetical protein VSS37_12735 [Candidatus Thiothrix sp. Deng01]|uniref:Tetratricopeptide repeat protein n=1 Tax=Candidatus Thiothrix phosphatis TaxID=3112415 RepID=A0ABU6CYD3_9GAMM|nr:hypothetical protein [Candidatus Thiothrix sp. Deng01]MEB4591850.1 hypothetical protein [Candidatus Thiothrix sp. Deng01]